MNKLLLLIFSFIIATVIEVSAVVIDGGIEYKQEFSYPSQEFLSKHYFDNNLEENRFALSQGITKFNDREIGEFSDGTYGVMYYDDPEYSWYYTKSGKLVNFTQKSSLEYPMKITKYKPDGTVVNTGIKVSKTESFLYNKEGKLIAHWSGNLCFDANNNIIMTRKKIESD